MSDDIDFNNMLEAQAMAQFSLDPSTQVGAIVVDGSNEIIGRGWNQLPKGYGDGHARAILGDREQKYPRIIHAETMALFDAAYSAARYDLDKCTLYVWPLPMCNECAKQVIASTIISRVVWPLQTTSHRWSDANVIANEMLLSASITRTQINMEAFQRE